MILLRLLSWPYVRKHLLRSLLTVAGIVLGVTVFVGMHTANESVREGFRRTVDRIAGAAQLQVAAGETGFDEDVLERVQATPGVRVAVPVIEATADTGLRGQGSLLVLGVDMTGDRSLRDYEFDGAQDEVIDDPLIFLAQPDSIVVTRQFADRNGLKIGGPLVMRTMLGERRFTVRGIMRTGGIASAFGGNLAIMDIYAAQLIFGRGRKFDRVDLALTEGAPLKEVSERLSAALGPGFQVEPPSSRGQHFESVSRAFSMMISLTSVFALLIGMFIIYNAFSIAVTQRRSEIGILRALGATRGQIRTLFLMEGFAGGMVGSLAGVAAGTFLSRGIAGYISGLLGDVYGLAQRAEETSGNPKLIAAALGLGVAASVVASWLPARSAARVDPVKALQKGRYQVLSAGENRLRTVAAVLMCLVAAGCLTLTRGLVFFYAGYVLVILAALLLTPAAALWSARALRPVLKWLRPVEGALAADSLIQAPRRTSATVSALMLSLALAIGFAGIARSSYDQIVDWLDTALNPDLFVSPSQNFTTRSFRFPAAMGEDLKKIDGIAEVQRVRTVRVEFRGSPVMIISAEVEGLGRRAPRPAVEGNTREMYALTARGKGVMASDNLMILRGLKLGDMVEIDAPNGTLRLPIVGTIVDYSDQLGSLLLDREVFRKFWNDDSVNTFRVYLKPGAGEGAVKTRILEKFSDQRRLFVFTNAELRGYILRLTEQWFGLTWVQLAVAVLVAVLGIVNSLTVSIADRRRELGVLQAVGGLRGQIRHTIWMEAASVGAVGLFLGLALGALNLYFTLEMVRGDFSGYRLAYQYPFGVAAILAPVILGAAFLAALAPAEAAVRGRLVEALEYE
ncbi:MAG: FtsX-like permease family protein [Acidobacteria bacterium]|nr:FtsX-like permease family protein [Acidobacteriota bacterium]